MVGGRSRRNRASRGRKRHRRAGGVRRRRIFTFKLPQGAEIARCPAGSGHGTNASNRVAGAGVLEGTKVSTWGSKGKGGLRSLCSCGAAAAAGVGGGQIAKPSGVFESLDVSTATRSSQKGKEEYK